VRGALCEAKDGLPHEVSLQQIQLCPARESATQTAAAGDPQA